MHLMAESSSMAPIEDWIKMRDAMIDVIQTGTGHVAFARRCIKSAGKTGTAQVKSIAQGKRYNEALLTERQLDHGLFVGFAPAEKPEIAIAVVWENGRHGGSAAQLARPIFDYWLLTRKKNPIRPQNHQVSGGLMTAGIKPGELPSGSTPPADHNWNKYSYANQYFKYSTCINNGKSSRSAAPTLHLWSQTNYEKPTPHHWRGLETSSTAFCQYSRFTSYARSRT